MAHNAAVLSGLLIWFLMDTAIAKWQRHREVDWSLIGYIALGFANIGAALYVAVHAHAPGPFVHAHFQRPPQPRFPAAAAAAAA
jgi:hypothetical protein